MTTADVTAEGTARKRFNLAPIQKFGRSLMLPIAALPVAALMLRLGQPDLLGADGLGWEMVAAVLGAGGGALFANLPLLFAVGVAIGMAKKADGSTAARGRRRLPRLQGRRGCRVALHPARTQAG